MLTTILHAMQVGSQFVQQYYTVLHSSPRYLHRFYTDLSTMTHSDGGYDGKPGRVFTVQNQKVCIFALSSNLLMKGKFRGTTCDAVCMSDARG